MVSFLDLILQFIHLNNKETFIHETQNNRLSATIFIIKFKYMKLQHLWLYYLVIIWIYLESDKMVELLCSQYCQIALYEMFKGLA